MDQPDIYETVEGGETEDRRTAQPPPRRGRPWLTGLGLVLVPRKFDGWRCEVRKLTDELGSLIEMVKETKECFDTNLNGVADKIAESLQEIIVYGSDLVIIIIGIFSEHYSLHCVLFFRFERFYSVLFREIMS